jgi:RTX calcium-binding nonapeptide repeat (4 copies)
MSSNLDQLPLAKRILCFLFFFIILLSLSLSPITSSPLFYNQKDTSVTFAEADKEGNQLPFFFPLTPNIAFAQSDKSGDPPSASFPLTVQVSTSCPGMSPVPAGTNGPDTIYGTDNGETINGLGGNDQLFGCGGDDTINGGNQNDNIDGGDGNDNLNGGNGEDTVNGGNGNDVVDGGNGKDTLNGGAGDDTIIGGNGGESLTGGTGADVFDCGHANDIVTDFTPTEGDTLVDCENATVADITPPDTTITSAVDGQNNAVSNGGTNPTDSITFTFTGTDNVGVDHFVCQLTGPTPSAAANCTSPKSYSLSLLWMLQATLTQHLLHGHSRLAYHQRLL